MCKILWLEDEETLITYTSLHLEKKYNFKVTATTSIPKALDLVSKETFELMIIDIMMPPEQEMDRLAVANGRETGVDVARRVKNIKADLPIIALTVVNDEEIRKRMSAAGIVGVIEKPVEMNKLVEKINQWVKSKR